MFKRVPLPTLLTATIVVLVLLVYAFAFQVRFNEVAVKVTLGEATEEDVITEPGLKARWPWPIQTIKTYDSRLRTLDTAEGEIKTRDGKNVIVGTYAVWRIADPLQFFIRVETVDQAEEKLRARITQRRSAVIGNFDLSAFVNLDEQRVLESYGAIEREILHGKTETEAAQSLVEGVREDFGIELVEVALRRISLPQETTQAVFEQMAQERRAQAAIYREAGKSRAASIEAEASAARESILAFARTKAAEERAKGVQAARRILEQIQQEDVEFFEWLRWLEALKASLRERSTIFLDSQSELFEPFVEPLAPYRSPDRAGAGSATTQPAPREE